MHSTTHHMQAPADLPSLAELQEIDRMAREVAIELKAPLKVRQDGSIVHLDPFHNHGVGTAWVMLRYVHELTCPYQRLGERDVWVAMLTPWAGLATAEQLRDLAERWPGWERR
ncbi:MAG TPA: hypothetical protein VHO25_22035 [Polyangiaceae bacterium]|nr:hypothetical protein [Polyangiaceae bacterium]